MAKASRRKAADKTKSGAKAERRAPRTGDPVDAMLDLVAAEGWRAVTFGRIATASDMSLSELYARYSSKSDLLVAYSRRIDAAMLEVLGPAPLSVEGGMVKDRLFEALMARLDAMTPHKEAIRALMRDLPGDPAALVCFLYGGLRRGLDWALASADLDATGLAGGLRRKVLGAVYLVALRVWLRDDGADLAATMAHLDRRLSQASRCLTARPPLSRRRDTAAEAAAEI